MDRPVWWQDSEGRWFCDLGLWWLRASSSGCAVEDRHCVTIVFERCTSLDDGKRQALARARELAVELLARIDAVENER